MHKRSIRYLLAHDYNPEDDYALDENVNSKIKAIVNQIVRKINSEIIPELDVMFTKIEVGYVKLDNDDEIALYIDGTSSAPYICLDVSNIKRVCKELEVSVKEGIETSIYHELAHAIQDHKDEPYDEDEAEDFAVELYETGIIYYWKKGDKKMDKNKIADNGGCGGGGMTPSTKDSIYRTDYETKSPYRTRWMKSKFKMKSFNQLKQAIKEDEVIAEATGNDGSYVKVIYRANNELWVHSLTTYGILQLKFVKDILEAKSLFEKKVVEQKNNVTKPFTMPEEVVEEVAEKEKDKSRLILPGKNWMWYDIEKAKPPKMQPVQQHASKTATNFMNMVGDVIVFLRTNGIGVTEEVMLDVLEDMDDDDLQYVRYLMHQQDVDELIDYMSRFGKGMMIKELSKKRASKKATSMDYLRLKFRRIIELWQKKGMDIDKLVEDLLFVVQNNPTQASKKLSDEGQEMLFPEFEEKMKEERTVDTDNIEKNKSSDMEEIGQGGHLTYFINTDGKIFDCRGEHSVFFDDLAQLELDDPRLKSVADYLGVTPQLIQSEESGIERELVLKNSWAKVINYPDQLVIWIKRINKDAEKVWNIALKTFGGGWNEVALVDGQDRTKWIKAEVVEKFGPETAWEAYGSKMSSKKIAVKVGDSIYHDKFGNGRVIELTGTLVTVQFDNGMISTVPMEDLQEMKREPRTYTIRSYNGLMQHKAFTEKDIQQPYQKGDELEEEGDQPKEGDPQTTGYVEMPKEKNHKLFTLRSYNKIKEGESK